jgi:hypothetical protein
MNSLGLHNVRILSCFWKLIAIHAVVFCALLPGTPLFAQQNADAGATVDRQDAGAGTVAQDVQDRTAESSSQENQAQASWPNAPSASQPAYSNASSLTLGKRFNIYGHEVIRPYTLVGPALGAGVGQWENEPPEWGQGGEGYARRFASGVGRHVIAETIRFAVAAADSEDPRFRRSDETGVWNRTRHVFVETFTSQTSSGTRIPAFSRFAGIYGAAFISNLWYPDSRATTGYALRRGSTALGSSLGFHLFEEFVPLKYFKSIHAQD